MNHLVVLECGEGKSDIVIALVLLISKMKPLLNFNVIVVLPFVAMMREWEAKLCRLGQGGVYAVLKSAQDVISTETKYKHRQGKEPSRDEILTPIFFSLFPFIPLHKAILACQK